MTIIASIERPADSPRADLYYCNLMWKTEYLLMIGWADNVQLVLLKEKSKSEDGIGIGIGPSLRYAQILSEFFLIYFRFKTNFIISGIAPLDDTLIVLLGFANLEVISDEELSMKKVCSFNKRDLTSLE